MTTKKFNFSVTILAAMILTVFCAIESTFSSPAEHIDRLNSPNEDIEMERKEGIKLLNESLRAYNKIKCTTLIDDWELYYNILSNLRNVWTHLNNPNITNTVRVLNETEHIDRINSPNKDIKMQRMEGVELLNKTLRAYNKLKGTTSIDDWELYYNILTSLRDGTLLDNPEIMNTVRVLHETSSEKISSSYVFHFEIPGLEAHQSVIDAILQLHFMETALEPTRAVTIKVYQVLDGISLDYPNSHKFLASKELDDIGVSSHKIFNVTDAVLDWISGTPNLGLLVTASDKDEQNVNVEISRATNNDWTQPTVGLLIHREFLNVSSFLEE